MIMSQTLGLPSLKKTKKTTDNTPWNPMDSNCLTPHRQRKSLM